MTEAPESTKKCKQCGSPEILPVVYGLPTAETFARAAVGEVLLGGCVIMGDDPGWRCARCGAPFDMEEFAPDRVQELLAESGASRQQNNPDISDPPREFDNEK